MTESSATFAWLRKNGGTRSHAIESTGMLVALCGLSAVRRELWLPELEGMRRCEKCIAHMATNYPSTLPGVAALADMTNVAPAQALRMVEQGRERRPGAVVAWLAEQLGMKLTDWQVCVLRHAFGESESRDTNSVEPAPKVSNKGFRLAPIAMGELDDRWLRALAGPGACPFCYLRDGFHDHGEPGSRHDAYRVPRHLVRVSNTAARRAARAQRVAMTGK